MDQAAWFLAGFTINKISRSLSKPTRFWSPRARKNLGRLKRSIWGEPTRDNRVRGELKHSLHIFGMSQTVTETIQRTEGASRRKLPLDPPTSVKELRDSIPAHCWQRSNITSFSYLAKDCALIAVTAWLAYSYIDAVPYFPLRVLLWAAYVFFQVRKLSSYAKFHCFSLSISIPCAGACPVSESGRVPCLLMGSCVLLYSHLYHSVFESFRVSVCSDLGQGAFHLLTARLFIQGVWGTGLWVLAHEVRCFHVRLRVVLTWSPRLKRQAIGLLAKATPLMMQLAWLPTPFYWFPIMLGDCHTTGS